MATASENVGQAQAPKKRSKVFLIILMALVVGGTWFGITKWHHAQLHAETDDAQICSEYQSDHSPYLRICKRSAGIR